MSIITVEVGRSAHIAAVVRIIRPITGMSIAAIRRALETGAPIFERELFLNDFAEVADSLHLLVDNLRQIDVPFAIRENGHTITPEVLNNILDGSDEYRL